MGAAADVAASRILAELRSAGIATDCGLRGNMKKRLQRANAAGARYAVIIGDSELEAGGAQVKDLESGAQTLVPFDRLAEFIRR